MTHTIWKALLSYLREYIVYHLKSDFKNLSVSYLDNNEIMWIKHWIKIVIKSQPAKGLCSSVLPISQTPNWSVDPTTHPLSAVRGCSSPLSCSHITMDDMIYLRYFVVRNLLLRLCFYLAWKHNNHFISPSICQIPNFPLCLKLWSGMSCEMPPECPSESLIWTLTPPLLLFSLRGRRKRCQHDPGSRLWRGSGGKSKSVHLIASHWRAALTDFLFVFPVKIYHVQSHAHRWFLFMQSYCLSIGNRDYRMLLCSSKSKSLSSAHFSVKSLCGGFVAVDILHLWGAIVQKQWKK